jgi:hypothetical protein
VRSSPDGRHAEKVLAIWTKTFFMFCEPFVLTGELGRSERPALPVPRTRVHRAVERY